MTKRRPLPPADLATLRQRYPHEPTARIAADMGRTVRTVYGAALHRAVVRVTSGGIA